LGLQQGTGREDYGPSNKGAEERSLTGPKYAREGRVAIMAATKNHAELTGESQQNN